MIAVTGGGGFLGTNLIAGLLESGHAVRCIEEGDDLDFSACDTVVHLAANADVRHGWSHPMRDLERNTIVTVHVLEAMRRQGVRRLLFASSSSVYGNAPIPTPETYSGQQTSLYGASKLAGEGLIGAYAEAGHISATILRLTSMLGPHYRHGLVANFVREIEKEGSLTVLGGGSVARTRMDVSDGVAAFLLRLHEDPGYEVLNVSRPDTITSLEVAMTVADCMGVNPKITIVGESWVGDHPILLDATKIRELGWEPRYTIPEGIQRTVEWLTR